MLKSGMMTVTTTVVIFVVEPLMPLTVTVYEPEGVEGVVETVSVAVVGGPGETGTLVGLTPTVGPPGGAVEVRLTIPLNPRSLVRVMVDGLD
jgi:hypothetical protein